MNEREANSVLDLLRHLDGSQVTNSGELIDDVHLLADAAGVALGGALPLDLGRIATALDVISTWLDDDLFYDDDADEYRPVDDVQTGDVL